MKIVLWVRYVATVLIVTLFLGATLSATLRNMPVEDGTVQTSGLLPKKPVLIIDAGHGGEDGGAVSLTGTYESDINLAISKRVELLAAFLGHKVVMTRDSDTIDYPEDATSTRARKIADQKSRVSLINSVENGVTISIHQNKFSSPGPSGTQVFFAPTGGSNELGTYLQEIFLSQIDPTNRRTAVKIPDSIYLMNSIHCPAVLIECGFLSNETEARRLEDLSYQIKLAIVISGGFSGYSENFSVNGERIENEN